MHRKWKQGGVSWAVVCLCRDRIRKAKVQMELNLVRDVKDNKKGFYRYIGRRRRGWRSAAPGVACVDEERKSRTTELGDTVVGRGGLGSHGGRRRW